MRRRLQFTKAFGSAVREARISLGLSQERLAFKAGVHPTYVSHVERGVKSPTLEIVASLARALNQKPHALIRAAEELIA